MESVLEINRATEREGGVRARMASNDGSRNGNEGDRCGRSRVEQRARENAQAAREEKRREVISLIRVVVIAIAVAALLVLGVAPLVVEYACHLGARPWSIADKLHGDEIRVTCRKESGA